MDDEAPYDSAPSEVEEPIAGDGSASASTPTDAELGDDDVAEPGAPGSDPGGPSPSGLAAESESTEPSSAADDGDGDAPSASAEPEAADVVAALVAIPDANISVGAAETSGLRLQELACRADNRPLFGSMALLASIGEQKRAIDRCAPKGGAVVLAWSFRDGKARDVEVQRASSKRTGECVAKAMRKVQAPFAARCAVVVLAGDAEGADEALAELRAAAQP